MPATPAFARGHVLDRADVGAGLLAGAGQDLATPKSTNFGVWLPVHEHVLWLDVAVQHASRMGIRQASLNSPTHRNASSCGRHPRLLQHGPHVSPATYSITRNEIPSCSFDRVDTQHMRMYRTG